MLHSDFDAIKSTVRFVRVNGGDSRALVARLSNGEPLRLQCPVSVVWSKSSSELRVIAQRDGALYKLVTEIELLLAEANSGAVKSIAQLIPEIGWHGVSLRCTPHASGASSLLVFEMGERQGSDACLNKGASCVPLVRVEARTSGDGFACELVLAVESVHLR
jgi:hypothetical protein